MKKKHQRELKYCPIDGCPYESYSYLDLARHMIEIDRRPPMEHQDWLEEALGKRFEQYAFGDDKKIADVFAEYCRTTDDDLPSDPQIFNTWLKQSQLQSRLKLHLIP